MPRSRSTASKASPRRRAERKPTAVRIHEATGTSAKSWDAAITDAVRSAKDEAPRAIAVEVGRLWVDLDERSGIRRYRVTAKIAYPVALTPPAKPRKRAITR